MKHNSSPSLIKWSGSKRSQAEAISRFFPSDVENYYEPFLGSGAVLYYATLHFKKTFGSDIYSPLIEIWKNVKAQPEAVISTYEEMWHNLQKDFPDYFFVVRERFNKHKNGNDLLFLSRTCVNGIIRFNSKGDFNNSLHVSRRGMLPERFANVVMQWNSRLKNTDFAVSDYSKILDIVQPGDFVYLDPPYANSHNRYINNLDLDRFIDFLVELNDNNVLWALSFDGMRGEDNLMYNFPNNVYKYHTFLNSGNSAVQKVLNSSVEQVQESLYLNYTPNVKIETQGEFAFI